MITLPEQMKSGLAKTESAMKQDFTGIRTGKASGSLVENIQVEYYGTMTRMRDIAGITTPDARTVSIQPWDKGALGPIERAIINSNLGISPVNDGKVIRLPIPPLSEERRQGLCKQVKTRAEEAKVALRNIRRDVNELAKKAQKASEITEDQLKDLLDKIQKITDDGIKMIDTLALEKEKDILTV